LTLPPPAEIVLDILYAMRWPLIALVLAMLYQLAVRVGGGKWVLYGGTTADSSDEYDFVPKALDAMSWRAQQVTHGRVL